MEKVEMTFLEEFEDFCENSWRVSYSTLEPRDPKRAVFLIVQDMVSREAFRRLWESTDASVKWKEDLLQRWLNAVLHVIPQEKPGPRRRRIRKSP